MAGSWWQVASGVQRIRGSAEQRAQRSCTTRARLPPPHRHPRWPRPRAPTPIPTPVPPSAGPGGRPWTITVSNSSSQPATLFVAEETEQGLMGQRVGSATPSVVPPGTTVEVTFLVPATGGDGWSIFVKSGPTHEGWSGGPTCRRRARSTSMRKGWRDSWARAEMNCSFGAAVVAALSIALTGCATTQPSGVGSASPGGAAPSAAAPSVASQTAAAPSVAATPTTSAPSPAPTPGVAHVHDGPLAAGTYRMGQWDTNCSGGQPGCSG